MGLRDRGQWHGFRITVARSACGVKRHDRTVISRAACFVGNDGRMEEQFEIRVPRMLFLYTTTVRWEAMTTRPNIVSSLFITVFKDFPAQNEATAARRDVRKKFHWPKSCVWQAATIQKTDFLQVLRILQKVISSQFSEWLPPGV